MHPGPLRGRRDELATLDESLARVLAGRCAVLLVEGPPGIGKSALLTELGARAEAAGLRVVQGRCFQDLQTVPYAPLFEAVLRAEPPLCDSATLRELSAVADSLPWIVETVRDGVEGAVETTPLCLCLDDVNWADVGTVAALQQLVDTEAPVLWALAMQSAGGHPEIRAAVDAVVDAPGDRGRRLLLGGLADDAVAEMAADVLGVAVDDSVLRLARTARGNPFLVLELLEGLEEDRRLHVDGGRAWAAGVAPPERLTATMQRRLDRLSATARNTVRIASILPAVFSADLLARTVGGHPSDTRAAIAEAVRADLLTNVGEHLTFRHDLLRRAAQQTMPYALRRAVERESASIMLDEGVAPEEVAGQLIRSAELGDVTAARSLLEAAETLSRSDPSGAADLGNHALRLLRPGDELRARVVTTTVTLLDQALRHDEAEALSSASLSVGASSEEEAAIRLSRSTVSRPSFAAAAEENRRALQLPHLGESVRARHLAWLGYNLAGDGQAQAAVVAALAALTTVDRSDDPMARTIAECALVRVNCAAGHGRDCLTRLYELRPDPSSPLFGRLGAVVAVELAAALASTGHCVEATDLLATARLDSRGIAAAEQMLDLVRAQCALLSGHLAEARALLESALPHEDRLLPGLHGGIGFAVTAALAAHTDDRESTRDVGIAARSALGGGPATRRTALAALARAAWQRGDEAEAARWLGEDVDPLVPPRWPTTLGELVLTARVASVSCDAGLRQRVVAAVASADHGARTETLPAAVTRHARALLDDDVQALDEATEILASTATPILYAGAVEDGGARRMQTDPDGATARLQQAFDLYADLGCVADARRVARSLAAMGVQRRVARPRVGAGWDSLTASEERVLEIVADGATNRQVAERLGVSPHTVNAHLRKVFAKLDVHSRAELIALARGNDTRPSP